MGERVTHTSALGEAQRVWAALVPVMAGNRSLRLSKDGGRSYPRRWQRRASDQLPNQPAALLVYDDAARAPLLCLDLDSSRGDVDADLARLTSLLDKVGLRSWFSDHSPSGGCHIYVPLADPAPLPEAAAATRALAALAPTLDPQPMLNALAGCLRPPGARHRSGGFQTLDQSLNAAVRALHEPNPPQAWRRLLAHLAVDATPTSTTLPRPDAGTSAHDETQLDPLRGYTEPDTRYRETARTGDYDPARYSTPSEARQGVVWACVAAGWTFTDLARRLEDGTWRGLASFYARYPANQRHTAVQRDWRRAIAFEKRRRNNAGIHSVRVRTTSPHKSQRAGGTGTLNREVRVWLAAVDLLTGPDTDLSVRAVLYALAQAAVLSNSLVVEHGNRHLALASGRLDQSTVGRVLKDLLEAPTDRGLVDLVRPAQGVRAHSYRLTIPPLLRPVCEAKPWRRGRIHGIRPVFRELGLPAAFAYAALEQVDEPISGRDLAARARIGRTAAAEALHTLAEWGLVTPSTAGWTLGNANLDRLAEAWGIVDEIRAQIARYRAERATWIDWLVSHGIITDPAVRAAPPPDHTGEPPDADQTAVGMVERILGGTLIA